MTSRTHRARTATAGLALLAVAAAPALHQLPALGAETPAPAALRAHTGDPADLLTTIGDTVEGLSETTGPVGADGAPLVVAPSAAQRAAAAALGERVRVAWNSSGTPAAITALTGSLAGPSGKPAEVAARDYLRSNAAVLGISAAQVDALEIVGGTGQELAGTTAEAVLFRQKFGDLVPATRSMVTVGVGADGSIQHVTSSLTKAQGSAPAARLTPLQGWFAAATDVGLAGPDGAYRLALGDLVERRGLLNGEWTQISVPGLVQTQLARLRAYATSDGRVRPVVEANVVDVQGGSTTAYRVMVDAVTGDVLFRQNAEENINDSRPFTGTYPGNGCSAAQPFTVPDDKTRTIVIAAAAVVAVDDISIKLTGPGGALGTFDLLTSPETATYSAPGGGPLPRGTYSFQVCAFDNAQVGGPFTAIVTLSEQGAPGAGGGTSVLPQPTWRAFAANPTLSTLGQPTGFSPDNSVIECWTPGTPGCSPREAHQNQFSFGAWDTLNGVPTLTTIGNNASTREAWVSPLTPGGLLQAPVSATRAYTQPFTDVWNNSGCNPANLVPGGNDINAVTTNLFVGHNRIHDFAYGLGFTEGNYNLQVNNGDRGGLGADPEVGNVQAGALIPAEDPTGALPFTGRDNANQIALQDGVPGITNQYLFQPLAGAFYSPCADGSLDTGIYGHEYTHAISNRMVGGPDDGLTSEQGGAMGESWSDLVAAEYQFENDYPTGTNPWSLGSYATGNFTKGIRDYAINDNPLNYSDYGFDTTGPEVHADGEIWNATLWEVRQALVDKWNEKGFLYADKALQQRCESPGADPTENQLPARACPGNRRWVQLIFDSFLLQPGATDMLQARDAMLAADRMRFGGENQAAIAAAFARRGMGADAVSPTPDADEVTPSFRSPLGNNSAVTFTSASPGAVYVGSYEARATPVAHTKPTGTQSATAVFTPGVYRMTFVSPTSGFRRFVLTVQDNGVSFTQPIDDAAVNLAAAPAGATLIPGAGTSGSLNAASLIDGTESTNWAGTAPSSVDLTPPAVAVDLAGGTSVISAAKVSALLRPADEVDANAGSRFTALRQFALEACTSGCENPANYRRFYTSPADAFPADIPRPVAPDQTMRTFRFPAVQAAAVRLVALENQCTGQARYAGEQDQDPLTTTDCKAATDRDTIVHAAELQVFGQPIPDDPAEAPAGDGSPGSGTAGQGTNALPLPGQATLGASTTTTTTSTAGPARTRTRIRLPRVQQVRGKESTAMKFSVVSRTTTSGGAKAGTAVVRLDGKRVKKVKIAVTRKAGKKVVGRTYRVPSSLGFGPHRLQVRFKPSNKAVFTRSASRRITLTVVLTRPNTR